MVHEIGYKSELLDGFGHFTTSAFYKDIEGEAIFGYDPATNTFPIENMDTKSYGLEAEARFDLANGFDIGLGVAWTQSEITGVQAGSLFPSAVGQPAPNVPEFVGVISIGHEDYADFLGLPDALFRGLVTYRHMGSRSVDPSNNYDLAEMNIVDARLSLTKGNIEFYIFGENLLDKKLEQQGSQPAPGTNSVTVSRGRTVGLGLTVNF